MSARFPAFWMTPPCVEEAERPTIARRVNRLGRALSLKEIFSLIDNKSHDKIQKQFFRSRSRFLCNYIVARQIN
jgi:hypothetical protein